LDTTATKQLSEGSLGLLRREIFRLIAGGHKGLGAGIIAVGQLTRFMEGIAMVSMVPVITVIPAVTMVAVVPIVTIITIVTVVAGMIVSGGRK
jgi:hypothetical protein